MSSREISSDLVQKSNCLELSRVCKLEVSLVVRLISFDCSFCVSSRSNESESRCYNIHKLHQEMVPSGKKVRCFFSTDVVQNGSKSSVSMSRNIYVVLIYIVSPSVPEVILELSAALVSKEL